MIRRALGRTGLRVSEIGFGAWGIGGELWKGSDDKESMIALREAAACGVDFFDSALAYGNGHSEHLVGRLLKAEKSRMFTVATKIPPLNRQWPARTGTGLREAFPLPYILKCTDESRKNLQLDTIDIQQFHVWNDAWSDDNEWRDAVLTLKEKKHVQHVGISVNDHQPANVLRTLDSGLIDTVQVIYNIFDQSPEEKLFPYCLQHGIGVIVRVPFDEGSLTGSVTPDTAFQEGDFRYRYFRDERRLQVAERVGRLSGLLGSEAKKVPELALRFVLHHPAVSTVIAGMRTSEHVQQNCRVSDGRTLGPDLIRELRKHVWLRNFYE